MPMMIGSKNKNAVLKAFSNLVFVCIVKRRVAPDKILEVERIAQKYNHKVLSCWVGGEVWNECVEPEHSTQVMMQMIVL